MMSLLRNLSGLSAALRRPYAAALVLVVLQLSALTVQARRASAPARGPSAQEQAVIGRLVLLNKQAMDDYDTADFDAAKKLLLDAEKSGKRAGLEGHPVMARTYIHLGALYLVGYKDKQKAQHYFGKALDIQPDIRLDKTLTSATVREAFESVQGQRGQSTAESLFPPSKTGGDAGQASASDKDSAEGGSEESKAASIPKVDPDAEPALPTTITALDCPYPDDTPPGKKVILRCVGADSLGLAGVALYYKGHQMKDYERLDMARSPKGWWQATIPKNRVDGKSVQFYFEGLNSKDKAVVSNGRAESPNVMLIVDRGNTVAPVVAGTQEEENPLEEGNRSAPRFSLGRRDDRVAVDTRYGNRRFWIGLGVGTGFSYAISGLTESQVCGLGGANGLCDSGAPGLSHSTVTGAGWSRLAQLVPEIGVQLNPDWAISIEGRDQWIPSKKGYTASGANSVLVKVFRYTRQQRVRFYYGLTGGGGEGVRMGVQVDDPNLGWDTIRIGGILLGATGGINYEISTRFTWTAGVNALYGFPKKGLAVDLNTGLQLNFGDTSGAAAARAAKRASSVSTSIDDEDPK